MGCLRVPPRRRRRVPTQADAAFIAVVQSTFIAGSGCVTQMAAARKSSDDDTEKAEEMAEESLKDD